MNVILCHPEKLKLVTSIVLIELSFMTKFGLTFIYIGTRFKFALGWHICTQHIPVVCVIFEGNYLNLQGNFVIARICLYFIDC